MTPARRLASLRQVSLFTAMSLDGFIATKDGGIEWLFHDQDYGYTTFFQSVDTVLAGRLTFEQSLSLSDDPFEGKRTYVFTRSGRGGALGAVEFIRDDPAKFTQALKTTEGGKIWLVGGGQINTLLMSAGLIDEMVISVHPVVLGQGIPLFNRETGQVSYTLVEQKAFPSGLVQLKYSLPPKTT